MLNELQQWLPAFQRAYEQRYPYELTRVGQPRQCRPGAGATGGLHRFEATLWLILVSQQPHPLHTMHALPCGFSQPPATSWLQQVLPVLQEALAALGFAPERAASRLATSPLLCAGAPAGAIEGTERRRPRPTHGQCHQEHYSGKKKPHTDTHSLVVTERTRQVVSRGPTVAGTTPDKKAAAEAEMPYPSNATLDKDPGVQGSEPERVLTTQPQQSRQAKR